MLTRNGPRSLAVPGDVNDRKIVHSYALSALLLTRCGFGADKRRKLRYKRLSNRRCRGALDDFTVLNWFAVQRLVAGLVWFQSRTVQVEAGESSLRAAEKENRCVGVSVGGFSISPGSRGIRTDGEPIRKQLRAPLLIQR